MEMPSPEEMAEMMEKWQAVMNPGEAHKKLEHLVGEWDYSMKSFWGGPGAPPIEMKGSAKTEWILGGRFISETARCLMKMPDPTSPGGMMELDFEGKGFTGYDKFNNMYVGSWMDNMGTHLLTMKGGFDPTGKILTMYGEMDEPMLDVHGRVVKYVTTIVSKDERFFEVYDLHAGDDYKVIEITYTRKK